jgi:hypothetical protein
MKTAANASPRSRIKSVLSRKLVLSDFGGAVAVLLSAMTLQIPFETETFIRTVLQLGQVDDVSGLAPRFELVRKQGIEPAVLEKVFTECLRQVQDLQTEVEQDWARISRD